MPHIQIFQLALQAWSMTDELLVAVTSRMLVMDLGYALNAA
jgi:hypothetical protein